MILLVIICICWFSFWLVWREAGPFVIKYKKPPFHYRFAGGITGDAWLTGILVGVLSTAQKWVLKHEIHHFREQCAFAAISVFFFLPVAWHFLPTIPALIIGFGLSWLSWLIVYGLNYVINRLTGKNHWDAYSAIASERAARAMDNGWFVWFKYLYTPVKPEKNGLPRMDIYE